MQTQPTRLAFLQCLTLFLAALFLAAAIGPTVTAEEAKTVRVVIDYGDGCEKHFTAIAWKAEMTVFDATRAAQAHPRGIKFKSRGEGTTAFLTKIDDVENEGRGRNWLFHVNGKQSDRGFGVFKLKAGDTVLWKFDKYR
jgi:hypothetical protein